MKMENLHGLLIDPISFDEEEYVLNRHCLVSSLNPVPYGQDQSFGFSYKSEEKITRDNLLIDLVEKLRSCGNYELISGFCAATLACAELGEDTNIKNILVCLSDRTIWIGVENELMQSMKDGKGLGRAESAVLSIIPTVRSIYRTLENMEGNLDDSEKLPEELVIQKNRAQIKELLGLMASLQQKGSEPAMPMVKVKGSLSLINDEFDIDENKTEEAKIFAREAERLSELLKAIKHREGGNEDPPTSESQKDERIVTTPKKRRYDSECYNGIEVDQVVEVRITKVTDFGAFARIGELNLEGLIPRREIPRPLRDNKQALLGVGQKWRAKVTDVDADDDKLRLSLRDLAYSGKVEFRINTKVLPSRSRAPAATHQPQSIHHNIQEFMQLQLLD